MRLDGATCSRANNKHPSPKKFFRHHDNYASLFHQMRHSLRLADVTLVKPAYLIAATKKSFLRTAISITSGYIRICIDAQINHRYSIFVQKNAFNPSGEITASLLCNEPGGQLTAD